MNVVVVVRVTNGTRAYLPNYATATLAVDRTGLDNDGLFIYKYAYIGAIRVSCDSCWRAKSYSFIAVSSEILLFVPASGDEFLRCLLLIPGATDCVVISITRTINVWGPKHTAAGPC